MRLKTRSELCWKGFALGDMDVKQVTAIPMDSRHRSKPDYAVLRKLTANQP
jgi:hypothetical protein